MVDVIAQQGTFPPATPTTAGVAIPSYLYKEYDDDADLQAFVRAYNELVQVYLSWFSMVPIAAYTNAAVTGMLLDWIAAGIYGILRPTLSSGRFRSKGPLNTWAPNTWPLNKLDLIGPSDVTVTTDDIFKRIITWNFYKGDGNEFNVRWLKRRLMRFLIGDNGTAPNIDQTYPISITFGDNNFVSIRISVGTRTLDGGALPNRFAPNQIRRTLNSMQTTYVPPASPLPNESVLKEALDSGVLQLPFQYSFEITVSVSV